jgi:hypothetical protein
MASFTIVCNVKLPPLEELGDVGPGGSHAPGELSLGHPELVHSRVQVTGEVGDGDVEPVVDALLCLSESVGELFRGVHLVPPIASDLVDDETVLLPRLEVLLPEVTSKLRVRQQGKPTDVVQLVVFLILARKSERWSLDDV